MEFLLKASAEVDSLCVEAVGGRLDYASKALGFIKAEVAGRTALIGFAGSPWTLANFMVEGGGVREYSKAKALFYSDRKLFDKLMGKLTEAVARFLQLQIDAGCDAVQIFDSLGGVLSAGMFGAASASWIKQIVASLKGKAPVIVFSKGIHGNWRELSETGANILGVDHHVPLGHVRSMVPKSIGLQGNLDPMILTTTPEIAFTETKRVL